MTMSRKEARIAYGLSCNCRHARHGQPCACHRCREAAAATRIHHPDPNVRQDREEETAD